MFPIFTVKFLKFVFLLIFSLSDSLIKSSKFPAITLLSFSTSLNDIYLAILSDTSLLLLLLFSALLLIINIPIIIAITKIRIPKII